MDATHESNSKTIRIATSLFFFICVPLSVWETSVQSEIFVVQNPAVTADNLLINELIFRTSIVSHLIGTFVFLIMMLLFYRILRPIDKHLSWLMIIPILAQIPIVFVFEALNFTALMTLKAEARPTFDVAQQQEVAYFLLRAHRYAFGADKIIFGLCFIPFGMVVFSSRIAPRVIGILMILGGAGYVADTFLYILLQRPDYLIVQPIKLFASTSYALGLLWFLVKGVSNQTVLKGNWINE